eukprot:CAMPEP_0172368880 /NCGR_PEP_ID=MMETSP1060-20121228/29617_1 /TAXON_ID=37318 /ORGANISM="Pseudo-nitzschia pungens, Strain cf. cingulata" /LENGTH=371 /DNA_ID=CAMNT_0013093617 /DNA_START=228 /DNA_END=1343 /DNA_ORIENTATION=-
MTVKEGTCESTSTSTSMITSRSKSRFKSTALSGSSSPNTNTNSNSDTTLELLQDLPLVPKEVLSKFLASVGDTLTRANLQAGYEAGAVSSDEMEEIAARMPGLDLATNATGTGTGSSKATATTTMPAVQSVESLKAAWDDAAQGQPWPVRKLCGLAGPTVVGLVAKLQEKAVKQASAMAWINGAALSVLQANATIVELLSMSMSPELLEDGRTASKSATKLRFNNTRARFEADKGVWSASMDVFDEARQVIASDDDIENDVDIDIDAVAPSEGEGREPSAAQTALEALMSEDSDGDNPDDLLTLTVGVLDPASSPLGSTDATATKTATPTAAPGSSPIGLVNAYFVPEEEIKILVVEIDGVLHNVTWKGLD